MHYTIIKNVFIILKINVMHIDEIISISLKLSFNHYQDIYLSNA